MKALLKREWRLAVRNASGIGLSLAFMALFILLCGLALDGRAEGFGPGLIWLGVTLATLLGLEPLYQPDQRSGALAQMHLAGLNATSIALAKALVFITTSLLPLIIIVPVLAPLFGMTQAEVTGTVLSLLIGLPALAVYASFTAALLAAQRGGGVISVILTAPLLIPILIFGIEAAQAYPVDGLAAVQFRILAGLSFIAVAVGGTGTAAAIAANRGPS